MVRTLVDKGSLRIPYFGGNEKPMPWVMTVAASSHTRVFGFNFSLNAPGVPPANTQNITILRTPTGFAMAPMHEGKIVKPEVFNTLPEGMRKEVETRIEALQKELETVLERTSAHKLLERIKDVLPGGSDDRWDQEAGLLDVHGKRISDAPRSVNFAVWWDGDLLRESLDGTGIDNVSVLGGIANLVYSMEPMGATVRLTADRAEVWVATQNAEASLATLSTASGLLLVISSAVANDVYYKKINPAATEARQVERASQKGGLRDEPRQPDVPGGLEVDLLERRGKDGYACVQCHATHTLFDGTLGTVLTAQGLLNFLGPTGWFNRTLLSTGLADAPVRLTNNYWGVFFSLVITGFPFAFLLVAIVAAISPLSAACQTIRPGRMLRRTSPY